MIFIISAYHFEISMINQRLKMIFSLWTSLHMDHLRVIVALRLSQINNVYSFFLFLDPDEFVGYLFSVRLIFHFFVIM